jgi:HSP20 family protein
MQTIRRGALQVLKPNRIIKTSLTTRQFNTTTPTMSLFPRAFQEFSPFLNLINEYDKAARSMNHEFERFSFRPRFDVKELNDSYELHGELPGLEQKDVNIEWTDGNTLTISGRTEHHREEGTRPGTEKVGEISDGSSKTTTVTTTQKAGELQKAREPEAKYWVSERSVGEFRRDFSFPARVDQDGVKASLKNGILSVIVPKAKGGKTKKVAIE